MSDVAAEAARIAVAVAEFSQHADLVEIILGAKRVGYYDGRAEWHDRQADANARKARAQFTVITGGKAPKARKGTAKAAPRKVPGGAA